MKRRELKRNWRILNPMLSWRAPHVLHISSALFALCVFYIILYFIGNNFYEFLLFQRASSERLHHAGVKRREEKGLRVSNLWPQEFCFSESRWREVKKNGEELSEQEEKAWILLKITLCEILNRFHLSLSPSHILIDSKKISWVARKWGSLEENFAHTQWSSENSFSRMEKRYWIIRNSRKSDFVHSQKKLYKHI